MAYVGRGLTTGAQYQKLDTISIDDATTFTMQVGGTAVTPAPEHLILAVNGVIQEPNVGFTLSGSTCTLASAIDNDGGSDTIWGMIAGDAAYAAVTALNNATANELVTVGSTTTELDAEANLTYDGTDLSMFKDSENTEFIISAYHDTEATTPQITLRKGDNTQASPALVDDDAVLGTISFQGYDGDSWAQGAKIEARAEGTPASDDMASELTFWTTPDSSQTAVQRMTIGQDGNVGIGTTDPGTHGEKLEVFGGEVRVTSASYTTGGGIGVSGGATAGFTAFSTYATDKGIVFATSPSDSYTVQLTIASDGTFTGSSSNDISDIRLKENISDIGDALDTISQIKGRTFTWKPGTKMAKGIKYGIIAQEIEGVLPDLVYNETGIRAFKDDQLVDVSVDSPEDYEWAKSVNMSGLIPVLVEAVKELSAKVEALENA